jgi:isocitrate/isopropylmalate dehydrogenase
VNIAVLPGDGIGKPETLKAIMRSPMHCMRPRSAGYDAAGDLPEVMVRVAREYPDVELSHMYVDAAAMLTGSIGMRRTGTEEMGDAVAKAIRHAG